MRSYRVFARFLAKKSALLLLLTAIVCTLPLQSQSPRPAHNQLRKHPAQQGESGIPALLLSDIHFDPFHDPGKLQQLVDAPVSQWEAILASADTSGQQQAFDSLQQKCNVRGVDTPFVLLRSSLSAMRAQLPDAKFITVSGDLIAHAFTCRYKTLLPQGKQADYESFVLRTIDFVVSELRSTFPGIPVYVALGNNDTDCGDYQLDPDSEFQSQAGKILAAGLPATGQQQAIQQFKTGGYFSVTMAAPMLDTRFIVLNDLFLSPKYATCSGKPNPAAAETEMIWLEQQLSDARKAGQKVWIMGHIPPGVNPYATAARMKNICDKASPTMFLASDKLSEAMVNNANIIRLAIFAHTHMDEMHLIQPSDGKTGPSAEHSVALKMVPSISPVDGNNPAFTIARITPATSVLHDYEVISASNQTGIATSWTREYDFQETYHQPQFTPATLSQLITQFKADSDSKLDISQSYIRNYFVGDRSLELKPFWPEYVCSISNSTAKSFTACVCNSSQ